jgi:hypothetical protein
MKPQDYFVLGCKLFGVYCLVLVVPAIVTVIPTFVQPQDLGNDLKQIYLASKIATILIPIIYISGGLYLIRSGSHLYRFAYPEDAEYSDEMSEKFRLFLKFLGIFLIITYSPTFLKTGTYYIAYTHAPKYLGMFQERQYSYFNIAPSIWGVGFGIYLLRGGQFIVKIALQSIRNVTHDETNK